MQVWPQKSVRIVSYGFFVAKVGPFRACKDTCPIGMACTVVFDVPSSLTPHSAHTFVSHHHLVLDAVVVVLQATALHVCRTSRVPRGSSHGTVRRRHYVTSRTVENRTAASLHVSPVRHNRTFEGLSSEKEKQGYGAWRARRRGQHVDVLRARLSHPRALLRV